MRQAMAWCAGTCSVAWNTIYKHTIVFNSGSEAQFQNQTKEMLAALELKFS